MLNERSGRRESSCPICRAQVPHFFHKHVGWYHSPEHHPAGVTEKQWCSKPFTEASWKVTGRKRVSKPHSYKHQGSNHQSLQLKQSKFNGWMKITEPKLFVKFSYHHGQVLFYISMQCTIERWDRDNQDSVWGWVPLLERQHSWHDHSSLFGPPGQSGRFKEQQVTWAWRICWALKTHSQRESDTSSSTSRQQSPPWLLNWSTH